ncbi:hypothetical protein EJ02DRAFT_115424 [Clathrospora elynae]|uniref:Uncharacterized protein n=1 Tax=Clathrospora elynae TaxID=706981 RepID=A0A6A5T4P3_9PLEO|nr:hypothetical protein EJ02DRAFT_115424 [Clathrospora elynae]
MKKPSLNTKNLHQAKPERWACSACSLACLIASTAVGCTPWRCSPGELARASIAHTHRLGAPLLLYYARLSVTSRRQIATLLFQQHAASLAAAAHLHRLSHRPQLLPLCSPSTL